MPTQTEGASQIKFILFSDVVRAAARRINPQQTMGMGPQGQMLRNQQTGQVQRGMPQPGMPLQNPQQHILEHEENLSDKEIYPGQHGQMVCLESLILLKIFIFLFTF